MLKIYTRTGDDGTTGLLYGGRVRKDAPLMQVTGTDDEAQAAMGMARAEAEPGSELDELLTRLERTDRSETTSDAEAAALIEELVAYEAEHGPLTD